MLTPSAALGGLWLLSAVLLPVSGAKETGSRSGMIQEIQAAVADLTAEGRTYLHKLAEEKAVRSVLEASSRALHVMAGGLAEGLNVVLQYVSELLQAAGVQGILPVKVTPEGLIFVAQWVLLALIGYWLFSLAIRLVVSTLRHVLWLLKVSFALVCFGLILMDHSVGTETMAIRLAVLVFVCVVIGVGSSRGSNAADQTAHLEKQVKILQGKLKEMEKWRRKEE